MGYDDFRRDLERTVADPDRMAGFEYDRLGRSRMRLASFRAGTPIRLKPSRIRNAGPPALGLPVWPLLTGRSRLLIPSRALDGMIPAHAAAARSSRSAAFTETYPVPLRGPGGLASDPPLLRRAANVDTHVMASTRVRELIGTRSSTKARDRGASLLTSQAYGAPCLDCIQNGSDQPQAGSGHRALLPRFPRVVPVLPSCFAAALQALRRARPRAQPAMEATPPVRHRGRSTRLPAPALCPAPRRRVSQS